MTWKPRLIALDIDGTLTREGTETISPAVRAAVGRAVDHGATVVLSTGRSLIGTTPIADDLGLRGTTAICSNGAVWWDTDSREVVHRDVFDTAPVLDVLRRELPGGVYASEVTGVGNIAVGTFPDGDLWGEVHQVDFAALAAHPTSRLVVRWLDRTPEQLALQLLDLDLPGVTPSIDHGVAWLTLTAPGVTKGSALERLRARLGVSESDTLAIGDGHNDEAMLRWAARGVAMGQAPATVHAVADAVTATVLEDGAALELDRWFAP
ncbi:HAD family hydrolase [Saccharothrix violaceirubra]|uniref:Hydroxymethylpyrimidine pyrophosphatase-like HAD family hydrolase n=1 Tax=Saccharothrix violaceirubra TaxID=413306 RepID=A0A7W7TB59_9PSEU|nr:HAD hydrolase family protein [Saccharothrix violaceirubra]MBB4969372.1 hydroxymethylpyrimidine pyrophosphatase-like HAD family hydrolase [Saccharothrix violaceirubra]